MRRALLASLFIGSAGCSLFLLDGLNDDEKPAAPADDGGNDAASSSSGSVSSSSGATSNDASNTDAVTQNDGNPDNDPYGDQVRADNPVGWWRLDDPTGSGTAKEATGKSVSATIQSPLGVMFAQPGAMAHGSAFVFDGTAYLDLGDRFNFPSPQAYTFEAWAKSAIPAADAEYHGIFTKIPFGPTKGEGRWMFFTNDQGTRVSLEQWTATANVLFVSYNQTLPMDRFVHLVVAFDGSTARFYVDGVLEKTSTAGGSIGASTAIFKWADGWKGALDELAIYDKALDGARIKAHFDASK